jgi:alkylation response protein AidB-like acyl-CoA dehydrogenase
MGTLPILYFGTEAQQKKYIPSLVSGESKGAYGLTEPNSGSDTMGIKTSAVLSSDGKHYLLNGQKSWITNGGIADVYTIFAKVDGSQFTAFIVERGMEGFSQGSEEHKMGLRGTSTVPLYFQDCKVPVENVLGEIGKGHHIALNILNTGRLKLCAANVGGAKKYLENTVKYARSRELFKAPIADLGAIRHKLGEMATRTWVVESALYRATSLIDEKEKELLTKGHPFNEAQLGAAEEYAIESTILKVAGSELIDFVVDEGVQVHGANGYNESYHIARAYRDSRVNRILEGTNEISRLLTVDMVFKRAMKGRLDMMGPAMAVQKELMSIPDFGATDDSLFAAELKAIQQFKKAVFLVAGAAVQKLMMKIESEQEILMQISDMAIDIFLAESALLRTIKLANLRGEEGVARELDMTRIYMYDAADRIAKNGRDAINAFASGDEQRMMLLGIKRFTKVTPFNTKDARRRIADGL